VFVPIKAEELADEDEEETTLGAATFEGNFFIHSFINGSII
jgi:hypothetical protein